MSIYTRGKTQENSERRQTRQKGFELLTILARGQPRAQHGVNPLCCSSGTDRQLTKHSYAKIDQTFPPTTTSTRFVIKPFVGD